LLSEEAERLSCHSGRHVDFGFIGFHASRRSLWAGKIRVLAFLSKNRHPLYPDVQPHLRKDTNRPSLIRDRLVDPRTSPAVISKWEELAHMAVNDPQFVSAIQKFDFSWTSNEGRISKGDRRRICRV